MQRTRTTLEKMFKYQAAKFYTQFLWDGFILGFFSSPPSPSPTEIFLKNQLK
jgi:hypothetical protein